MDQANSCATRLYNRLPTINFIIALNGCTNSQVLDSNLLKATGHDGIVWPGLITDVLTTMEINLGFNNGDIEIPPLRHTLLDRGYNYGQIDNQGIKVVLFQVDRHCLDFSFEKIWDWAFSVNPLKPSLAKRQPTLNHINQDDLSSDKCLVNAGDRGLLEVSSSTLFLSGSNPSESINLFCPELIQAGKPAAASPHNYVA